MLWAALFSAEEAAVAILLFACFGGMMLAIAGALAGFIYLVVSGRWGGQYRLMGRAFRAGWEEWEDDH